MLFQEFPKMARLTRECIITEKIDGTNAQIIIGATTEYDHKVLCSAVIIGDTFLATASRTRIITPEDDNFGFARWAHSNAEALIHGLGHGRHFGEWWGQGIQRGYGLKEKRFSLFNASRWTAQAAEQFGCHVVPILFQGMFDTKEVDACIEVLRTNGSRAVPGFMSPEGVVVFHVAGQVGFKKTLEKDEVPKGKLA